MTFFVSLLLCAAVPAAPSAAAQPYWKHVREQALHAQEHGDRQSAERYFLEALTAAKKHSVSAYFMSLEDLANYYWQLDDARSAEPYFRAAVGIIDIAAPAPNRSRPVAFNNFATVLRFIGSYNEAQDMQLRALHEFQSLGASLDVARCYASLAQISIVRGDFAHASGDLSRAVEVLDDSGADSVTAAATRVWIAQNFLALNKVPEAAMQIDAARPAVEGHLAESDPRMLTYLDTRGAVLFRRERYAEAERIWKRVLEAAGADKQAMGTRLHLGQFYSFLGEYTQAATVFTEVLEKDDPTPRGLLESELAWALLESGEDQRAESMFHSAMVDLEAAGLANSTFMAMLCVRYSRLYQNRLEWNDAMPLLQRAITIGHHTGFPQTADWLLQRGNVFRKLGNKKAAADSMKEAEMLFGGARKRATVDIRELGGAKVQP